MLDFLLPGALAAAFEHAVVSKIGLQTINTFFDLHFVSQKKLYWVNLVLLYRHLQHHNDTIIKTQEDFFISIGISHFIVRVRKGYSRFACEKDLEIEHNCNILTPTLMAVSVVSFLFSGCSTGGPGLTLLGDGFLYCILSSSSPDFNSSGATSPFGLVWLSLPHLVYDSASNCKWNWSSTYVLTVLYNSSTPARSPTRSLEWHDWSSSSGNNCHAIHRSLSSGVSVYQCIMGFTLSHFISQIHPRNLFRLLAIGMCHFLPMHHFVMACLLGPKVKIQQFEVV